MTGTDRDRYSADRAENVEQRTIPALPAEHDGKVITWRPWERAPVLSHVDPRCYQCAYDNTVLTFGLTGKPPKIRYQANRCPACQEMRVYRRNPARWGVPRTDLVEIAYHPPLADLLDLGAALVVSYPDLLRPHVDEVCDDIACQILHALRKIVAILPAPTDGRAILATPKDQT